MRFTKIPTDTFEKLQLNAGIILTSFNPASPTISNGAILGATTGGLTFNAAATYRDNGEDIDNCPKNMKELKVLESWEVTLSGTLLSIDTASAKKLAGAADISGSDSTKIVPRNSLSAGDFGTIWVVGDYSDKNNDATGGFFAIKLINALSTGGFQLRTQDKEKGQFAFVFTGHYSIEAQDTVPFELYISAGTASTECPVRQTLSHVTSDFEGSAVASGTSLTIQLAAESGYTFANVIVLVGGVDVTASKYSSSNHKVTLGTVTSDVQIIATATS